MKYSYGALADLSRKKDTALDPSPPPPWMKMPSNNSTSNPSLENLASCSNNEHSETYGLLQPEIPRQRLCRSMSLEEAWHKHVTGRPGRMRSILWFVMVHLVLSLGVILWWRHRRATHTSWTDQDLIPYGNHGTKRVPFSQQHPVMDLGLYDYPRPKSAVLPARPLTHGLPQRQAYPTNAWYQSLLLPEAEPEVAHRAYAIPYVLDAAGPVPGLRVHPNHIDASSFVVQLYVIEEYGLTVGAARRAGSPRGEEETMTHQYRVTHATPLGVTLDWDFFPMYSSITKGMPYATMVYENIHSDDPDVLPTIAAEIALAARPLVDGTTPIDCRPVSGKTAPPSFVVQREVELFFKRSDFTWLIFVSEPVRMHCILDDQGLVQLQVLDWPEDSVDVARNLVVRLALSKKCTSGVNPIYCHQEKLHPTALLLGQGNYAKQLRQHADLFPGPNTTFEYEFQDAQTATMVFNWDVQNVSDMALHPVARSNATENVSLIAFALPHHFDIIAQVPPADTDIYCVSTLIGPACLYEGAVWELQEPIPPLEFRAPRPPAPWAVAAIAESLQEDMHYTLPKFYIRGAGDTYFSGKMLAKLGRILLIAEELKEICTAVPDDSYTEPCENVTLPSAEDVSDAIATLRSSLEIWINGTAETPFVFDAAWGGVVSCGCDFDGEKEICRNKFPHCSGFGDPGLNFGNAFYNDVHFHYGYFIFAAAVVSHFDPEWGRESFENVLLLVRCIANPSEDDEAFPVWRHKDWYQGHSWASGIAMVFSNGKNQESSSEAIAAYEAIALYGKAMVAAWEAVGSRSNAKVALEVEQAGQLLTATELRSARSYWHVTSKETIKIYPSAYTPRTIGILWQTMAQCQTWFGSAAYLAYGIQLLPLTPISEYRDTLTWSKEMYHIFAESCGSDPECTSNGWSVIQLALLATVGHQQESSEVAKSLSPSVFESAGGNGHSLSNSLWYFATRPEVEKPLALTDAEKAASLHNKSSTTPAVVKQVSDCGKPGICTDYVLDTIAGEYSCRQRMDWLVQIMGKAEKDACIQIARIENPYECGACDPERQDDPLVHKRSDCAHCTKEQCESDLNRCPLYEATFVCTEGDSVGGCSSSPWNIPSAQCQECCELTHCAVPSPAELRAENEAHCPPCTKTECRASKCGVSNALQFYCLQGQSAGGCSSLPWEVTGVQCSKCCSLLPHCG